MVAVTGADAGRVQATLAGLGGGRLRLARAWDWEDGIAASLRRGVATLPAASRGIVVFLGDMPLVPAGAAGRLVAALEAGAPGAEYVAGDRPAHPVAFARALYPTLLALTGDQGGRAVLAGREGVVRIGTTEAGATFDVDVAGDLAGDLTGDLAGAPRGGVDDGSPGT